METTPENSDVSFIETNDISKAFIYIVQIPGYPNLTSDSVWPLHHGPKNIYSPGP